MDSSHTGVDEAKVPPKTTMIADFKKKNKQNYNDIKTMIEETKKRDNADFGGEIVRAAQAVRDKREAKNAKKDFLAEHATMMKNWSGFQQ